MKINPIQLAKDLWNRLTQGSTQTYVVTKDGVAEKKPVAPPVNRVSPFPTPSLAPIVSSLQGSGDSAEIERKIRKGFQEYARMYNQGNPVPAEKYIPQFVEATNRYPVFKKNPFLLPQISILETSGGKYITRPNNLLNWGINYPGNNNVFASMTVPQVLEKAISGLGERSPYYSNFRNSGDLQEFANIYEPANKDYYRNLSKGIEFFNSQ